MIDFKIGNQMLKTVSPVYDHNKTMLAVFLSLGIESEMTNDLVEDILLQLYPQTATWGLDYWEDALNIQTNKALPYEERRAKVLSKMQTRWPITKGRLEDIINNFIASKSGYVEEIFNEYRFKINIPLTDKKVYYKELVETVNEIKPAHLSYSLEGIAGNNTVTAHQMWARNFVKYLMCGTFYPKDDEYWTGRSFNRKARVKSTIYDFEVDYLVCGTFSLGDDEVTGRSINRKTIMGSDIYTFDVLYPMCGAFNSGEVSFSA